MLTYHGFGHARKDAYCVAPEVFAKQMDWIADAGLAVSVDELEQMLDGRRRLAHGAVLVTIDDGCNSLLRHALPVLMRHQIPALAFVSAGLLSAGRSGAGLGPLGRADLRELAAAGVEIGSHGWTHRPLGLLTPVEARREAVAARAALAEWCGRPIRAFAYPYGTGRAVTAQAAAAVRDAGYRLAFTARHGAVVAGADWFDLPRIKVEAGEGCWMFERLCAGGLDGWRVVDGVLWRLQTPAELPDAPDLPRDSTPARWDAVPRSHAEGPS